MPSRDCRENDGFPLFSSGFARSRHDSAKFLADNRKKFCCGRGIIANIPKTMKDSTYFKEKEGIGMICHRKNALSPANSCQTKARVFYYLKGGRFIFTRCHELYHI